MRLNFMRVFCLIVPDVLLNTDDDGESFEYQEQRGIFLECSSAFRLDFGMYVIKPAASKSTT